MSAPAKERMKREHSEWIGGEIERGYERERSVCDMIS
jgi:hypothetical protein